MNTKIVLKRSVSLACLFLMATAQIVLLPLTGNAGGGKDSLAPSVIIYDNGPLSTGANTKSGTAAPAGFTWSELSTDNGGGNFSNTTLGAGCQQISTTTNNRCADNFIVPAGQTWTINTVIVYGYQTNSVANPFISANLRIWPGRPGDPGVTVPLFGDTTTNRLGTPVDSTWFRVGNSLGGAGGVGAAAPNTARKIWALPLTVSPALVVPSGVYWIDFQLNGGANGNFTPLISIPGARSMPGWNGRQFIGTTSTWGDLIDIGEPAAVAPPQPDVVPDVQMEFAFRLDGSVAGASAAPPTSRFLDFDADNKTDYAVVRSATALTPSTWYIKNSNSADIYQAFGTGAGFASGDRVTPGDYNGDGRTDIAVWRPGAPGTAAYYILLTGSGTLRVEQFGQTGDDPTLVGDYDGDGSDEPGIYRNGATAGAQSFFYYRGSLSNPTGATTFIPWGSNGDIAIPGDWDGDGRSDFHVARASGGSYTHYELRSTAGFNAYPWGLSTDRLVSGDFDGDLRSDIVAVRSASSVWTWYVRKSSSGELLAVPWGNSTTDFLTPGDYDGDGKTDYAVWRSGQLPNQTVFWVKGTSAAPLAFEWGESIGTGTAPDYPAANFAVK